jgi:hypothetical protein
MRDLIVVAIYIMSAQSEQMQRFCKIVCLDRENATLVTVLRHKRLAYVLNPEIAS